jgi:VWFA-related protein
MKKTKSLLLIPFFMASLLWSQDAPFKLSVNVDLTEVHVNVTDEKDRPVGNLKKENFRIFEDRKEQQITVFKHEDAPISLGLVIDNSRSIEPRSNVSTLPPCLLFVKEIQKTRRSSSILMTPRASTAISPTAFPRLKTLWPV